MRYPVCHHTNEHSTRPCDRCGQPLEARCPTCERPNRVGTQFFEEALFVLMDNVYELLIHEVHHYEGVEGFFDCDDLGLLSLKDISPKIRVYRVRGQRAAGVRIDVARERALAPPPTQGTRDTMDLYDELTRGRESYRRQAWAAAYQALAQADQATLLAGEALERLATSAYLSGREDEFLRGLERALGDEDGGRLELDTAQAVFAQLGAAPDLAGIDSLRPRAPAGPPGTDAARVAGAAPGRDRQNQQGHRYGAVRERENGRPAREQHVRQAARFLQGYRDGLRLRAQAPLTSPTRAWGKLPTPPRDANWGILPKRTVVAGYNVDW